MKKLLFIIIIFLLAPLTVSAHSTLSSSLPAEGEIVGEPLEEVQLTFDSPIEEGSTMTLTGEEGEISFSELTVAEETLIGTIEETLPNGSYTVSYQIISEDGHPIQGEVPFMLEVETAAEEPAEEPAEGTDSQPAEEAAETSPETEEPADEQAASDLEEGEGSSSLTIILIAAAAVLLIAVFLLLRRKK